MVRRDVPLNAGEFYHLYNRGNNRERIFCERENYLFFLHRVRRYLASVMDMVAYCLMPNHYHLLVQIRQTSDVWQTSEVYDASAGMRRLAISYTKAMNKRYERVGSLFQGAFHAKHVGQDSYLLHLSAQHPPQPSGCWAGEAC